MAFEPHSFRLGQINILNRKEGVAERYQLLREHALREELDVIALQEVIHADLLADTLAPIGLTHFIAATPVLDGTNPVSDGAAIASRFPLSGARELKLTGSKRPALTARASTPWRQVQLFTAHLSWGSDAEGRRLQQAYELTLAAEEIRLEDPALPILLAGDLNSDEDSRTSRYLRGQELDHRGGSTYWTDAYTVCGTPEVWATSDQGNNSHGVVTASNKGIVMPELLPQRRIDYILSYGWSYGKIGCALAYGRFGDPLTPDGRELSDHYGIWADVLV